MNKTQATLAITIQEKEFKLEEQAQSLCNILLEEAQPMKKEDFYSLAENLRKLIQSKRYSNPHEKFFRRTITNEHNFHKEKSPKTFEDCITFVKTYQKAKATYDKALEGIPTGRSDDEHCDLIDCLPLAPKPILLELIEDPENFENWEKKHKKDIKEILVGKFYNESNLEKAPITYIPHAASNQFPNIKTKKKPTIQKVEVSMSQDFDVKEKALNKTTIDIQHKDFLRILTQPNRKCLAKIIRN